MFPFGSLQFMPFHHQGTFQKQYRCVPCSKGLRGRVQAETAEYGGKIFLPQSTLAELSTRNVVYPLMFQVTNLRDPSRKTHCGVLEFCAPEGQVFLPSWMMRSLGIAENEFVYVQYAHLPLGRFVRFRPVLSEFLQITNPRAVLESLLRNFSCLTKGDVIVIMYNTKQYALEVLEVRPEDAISIVEVDVEVEFAAPLDYVEPAKKPKEESVQFAPEELGDSSDMGNTSQEGEDTFVPFAGSGRTITGRSSAPIPTANNPRSQSSPAIGGGKSSPSSSSFGGKSPSSSSFGGKSLSSPSFKRIPAFVAKDAKPLDIPAGRLYFGYPTVPYRAPEDPNSNGGGEDPWAGMQPNHLRTQPRKE